MTSAAVAVFVGGCIGTALRIGLSALAPAGGRWPWPTFVANVTGALLLGYVLARLPRRSIAVPLLATGVLGSYTTFSALSLEAWQLLSTGRAGAAVGYATASVTAGFAAAVCGCWAGERRR